MALEKAVRAFSVLTVIGLTARMGQLVSVSTADPDPIFVISVLLFAYIGLAGLMREFLAVAIISGLLLSGIGFLLFMPSVLVAGMVLLVDGVSTGIPRLTQSEPA